MIEDRRTGAVPGDWERLTQTPSIVEAKIMWIVLAFGLGVLLRDFAQDFRDADLAASIKKEVERVCVATTRRTKEAPK